MTGKVRSNGAFARLTHCRMTIIVQPIEEKIGQRRMDAHVSDPIAEPPVTGLHTAKPYGLFGLCLSLAAILVLAILYAHGIGLIVDGCAKGWTHLAALLKSLGTAVQSHEITSIIADVRGEFSSDLLFSGLIASLIFYAASSLAVLTLARFRGRKQWRDLIGWRPWAIWKAGRAFWYIAAAGLACGLAADVAVAYFYPPSKDWFTVPKDNFASSVLLFILAVIFAPFAEELLFRGWIYTSLRARIGLWAALIISSAVFAGLHYEQSHIYALAVFPVGLALGALREVTGSLKASITFHAFFNALAFGLALLDLG